VLTSQVHDAAGWLMMPLALAAIWWEQRFLQRLFVDERAPGGASAMRRNGYATA